RRQAHADTKIAERRRKRLRRSAGVVTEIAQQPRDCCDFNGHRSDEMCGFRERRRPGGLVAGRNGGERDEKRVVGSAMGCADRYIDGEIGFLRTKPNASAPCPGWPC